MALQRQRARTVAPVPPPAPRPLATLEGSVVLPSGEPAVNAYVYAVERGDRRRSVPRLDDHGAFIDLHDCGVGCALTASAPPDLIAGPVIVEDPRQPVRLKLAHAPAMLTGKITDGHAPLPGTTALRMIGPQGLTFFGFADDAGAYSVGFPPASYELRASTSVAGRLIVQQERVLTTTQSLDWVLPPAGSVRVKPAGGSYTFWPPIDDTNFRRSYALDNGERLIENVPLGPRTLWIFDDRSVGHAEVDVHAGETTPASAELSPGAALSGRVVTADGAPIAGAEVRVHGPVPRVAYADHDGFYRLDGLAPVHTTVWAYVAGFVPGRQEVDPVAAEVSTLAFTMNRRAP